MGLIFNRNHLEQIRKRPIYIYHECGQKFLSCWAYSTHPPVSGFPFPCAGAGSAGGWQFSRGPDNGRRSSWASPQVAADALASLLLNLLNVEKEAAVPVLQSGLEINIQQHEKKGKALQTFYLQFPWKIIITALHLLSDCFPPTNYISIYCI